VDWEKNIHVYSIFIAGRGWYRVMINEIVMAIMFAALFMLVVSAVIVGGRMGKGKNRSTPETEEPPQEIREEQELQPEETPQMGVEQYFEYMGVEEPSLDMPEPDFFAPEQPIEMPEPEEVEETVEFHEPVVEIPELEEVEETVEFFEPVVELPEPETESAPKMEEVEEEASLPEVVAPEPVLLEARRAEEPVVAEPYEDTYREPAYFRDDDVIPVQGVTTCPHCGEKVPATLYCINCGKSLNE
jgi:hypothetical protein